jgi:hypothetical protein
MTFLALSLTLGLLLAQRFKVFVLMPATLLLAITAVAGGFTGTTAVTLALSMAALQLGYLLGLASRSALLGPEGPQNASEPGPRELPIKPTPGSAR